MENNSIHTKLNKENNSISLGTSKVKLYHVNIIKWKFEKIQLRIQVKWFFKKKKEVKLYSHTNFVSSVILIVLLFDSMYFYILNSNFMPDVLPTIF